VPRKKSGKKLLKISGAREAVLIAVADSIAAMEEMTILTGFEMNIRSLCTNSQRVYMCRALVERGLRTVMVLCIVRELMTRGKICTSLMAHISYHEFGDTYRVQIALIFFISFT
jgi:hypothetical protein